ncbi:F-box-like, partial [Rhizoctonia solani]
MEELISASNSFTSALRRYSTACRAATELFASSRDIKNTSNGILKFISLELQDIAQHELEIQKTRCILAQSRNSARTIAPINALPLDILTQIFDTVYYWGRCSISGEYHFDNETGCLRYPNWLAPDTLSHVCKHWRRVILASPSSWTHIDITNTDDLSPLFQKLLCRGETFAERALPHNLTVHLSLATPTNPISCYGEAERLNRFHSIVGSRTKSLELELWTENSAFRELLERSLVHAVPGVLQNISITVKSSDNGGVVMANTHQGNSQTTAMKLGIPEYFLSNLLGPVTVLRLRNLFFPWYSSAYSGLSDLRLLTNFRGQGAISIPIHNLRDILQSSPGLRILHLNINVDIRSPYMNFHPTQENPPISLKDLQELNLRRMCGSQRDMVFSIVQPGDRPLNLSVSVQPEVYDTLGARHLLSPAILDFSKRSNITRLYLEDLEEETRFFGDILTGLSVGPTGLRTLGLERFIIAKEITDNRMQTMGQQWPVKVEHLLMSKCTYAISTLRALVQLCPIQVFAEVSSEYIQFSERGYEEMATIFPVLMLPETGYPVDQWNELGVLDC